MCLPPCGFSCSPVRGGSFVNFLWTCQTTRVIAGKMHSQSPILKTKGAPRNPVILTYLWEQSCILHTLTKLLAYCNFDPKATFARSRVCHMSTLSIHACNEIWSYPNSFHCICRHCRYIQSNYNVDSNTKSWNYSKIQFNALIYFELQQSSN